MKIYGRMVQIFAWISALIFLVISACFLWLLVSNGIKAFYVLLSEPLKSMGLRSLFSIPIVHKIIPALFGTFAVILLTLMFASPLGIAIGVWSSLFASRRLKKAINFVIQLLASTPSIALGFAGYFAILFFHQKLGIAARPCLLLSALCLSLLVLPVIVRSTENALLQVPEDLKLTGLSLGFSPMQNALFVLLPKARKGLGRGVFLATIRAAEDSAVIMLTGAVADAVFPHSLKDPFSSLSIQILYGITESRGVYDQMAVAATTLVLMILTFILSFLGEKIVGGKDYVLR